MKATYQGFGWQNCHHLMPGMHDRPDQSLLFGKRSVDHAHSMSTCLPSTPDAWVPHATPQYILWNCGQHQKMQHLYLSPDWPLSSNHLTSLYLLHNELIEEIERILFKGARHFKRGHGLTVVPHNRFGCVYKKKKRKKTRCTICDETGHNKTTCPHKGEKKKQKPMRNYYRKRCDKCGQIEKGHICPGIKKDLILLNVVLKFFSNIF